MKIKATAALILAASLCALAGPTLAWQAWDAEEVQLKDGRTLLIFSDGMMSLRDARGRVVQGKDGETLTTAKGDTLRMKGNEVQRVTKTEALYLAN